MVEESLYSLTRCFGDLYAQHHGVSAEPEVATLLLTRALALTGTLALEQP